MDDNVLFIKFWKLIVIALACIVTSIASCTVYTNSQIGEAIKNGVDPIKAGCAFNVSSTAAMCIVVTTKS